ncbi:hypothetical protein [Tissierella creatinophila]|uniref:Lipoprotein chaperone n=1 Tax=Tissierella creatinophila DSM 6911 TaxID=1123403 RepID=A0A1U7M730_TISCR|nr:hypothetical protein [Tissierella creatinophila]OLS03060.1 hypothetical protein TICRE_07560 [Tissierella creatinophila DSM 6911]
MRKIVLTIFLLSIIMIGCSFSEERVVKKIEKQFNKCKGYESSLNITISMDGNKAQYKMNEKHIKDGKTIVEIIYPGKNNKITSEYLNNKIIINNPAIEQSITLNDFKDLDKGFLAKDIFDNIKKLKFIEEKEIDGKQYFAFDYPIKDKNKYNNKKILLFDKRELTPFSLEILDREGVTRTIILYENFKFLP